MRIQNFRSIQDSGDFYIRPFFTLVGENNSGKSNLLHAFEVLLSAGAGGVSQTDFKDPAQPIVIKGVFGDLSQEEKKRWKPYLVGEIFTLEKYLALTRDDTSGKVKLEAEFHGYRAEPQASYLSIEKILVEHGERPNWADIARQNNLPDYFLEGERSNKTIYTKALERFLKENDVPYDEPNLGATQALGFQANVVASLPKVYLLPAITDYSNEIDRRSTSTTFRRLMATLSERLLEKDPRFVELKNAVELIRGLLNRSVAEGGPARIEALSTAEAEITEHLQRIMPSVAGVSFGVKIDELKDLFSSGVYLTIDDGVETDVLSKGHGLQRCMVFALLQSLILMEGGKVNPVDGVQVQPRDSILLLIEEPELYIHPQLAKLFYDVLVSFSQDIDQVLISSHSPLFVDAFEAERVAIVKKVDTAIGTKVCNCDVHAFDGMADRQLFKGFSLLNPTINELFFAKRVLLVEGPEDSIAVSATLKNQKRITRRPEEIGWSVIVCGGKDMIPFFQRVLNAFQIPYAVLHDADLPPKMDLDKMEIHKRKNGAIAALRGANPVFTFPVKLEDSLGLNTHFSDQYEAHTYLSDPTHISPDVEKIITAIFA
jgi:putative ATP-dependent endonuclease of OLD family